MKTTGKQVAELVEEGRINKDFDASEVESGFHSALVSALYAKGWKDYTADSKCSVAYGGEHHLVSPNGRKVEIITSSFLGTFTLVQTR